MAAPHNIRCGHIVVRGIGSPRCRILQRDLQTGRTTHDHDGAQTQSQLQESSLVKHRLANERSTLLTIRSRRRTSIQAILQRVPAKSGRRGTGREGPNVSGWLSARGLRARWGIAAIVDRRQLSSGYLLWLQAINDIRLLSSDYGIFGGACCLPGPPTPS